MGWEPAASLRVDLVLADSRANAIQPRELATSPASRILTAETGVAAWHPELIGQFNAIPGGAADVQSTGAFDSSRSGCG